MTVVERMTKEEISKIIEAIENGEYTEKDKFFNLFEEKDIPAIVTATEGGHDEKETEISFESDFVKGHFTIYFEDSDLDETGQDFTDEAYLRFFEEAFSNPTQARLSVEAK